MTPMTAAVLFGGVGVMTLVPMLLATMLKHEPAERDGPQLSEHRESNNHKDRMLAKTNGWFHHVCTVPGEQHDVEHLPADIKVARFDGGQLSLVVTDRQGSWYVDQNTNVLGSFKVVWTVGGCQALPVEPATLLIPANGLTDLAMSGCGASLKVASDREVKVQVDAGETPCMLRGRTRNGKMNEERHTVSAKIEVPTLAPGATYAVTSMDVLED